ncbi:hypothetical protein C1I98_34760 [Spongiactinospora gelatinilytica]|uniref:VOC domain-containing protein n=1 Tax=Spongiactinospora gelatinilytica TaxID=2666298 RepID=A0A2W2FKN9_9ACTN|nr:VOC family protein [Spongiactinospora gelatinilytica]PZG25288.1 hypothetical protein C1I98_34760 [Spongiactinospora gelatinilytica]
MSHTMFVNLPVQDVERSKEFFTKLGFQLFGMGDEMASVVINERTQVMLLAEPVFAGYARNAVAKPADSTQVIMVIAADDREGVDALFEKAVSAGAEPVGDARESFGRYQRAFTDLDGHHWEALCLVQPA